VFLANFSTCCSIDIFKATPHQGSSFLSSIAFDGSIKKAMRLIYPVPRPLQKQLEVNSDKLVEMTLGFNRVAAELKLFSFYETIDTNLAPKANGSEVVIFTAPIVSIKSAVLELHHEVERPLDGNHADCAAFGKANNYAQWSYLEKLDKAVRKSLELCTKDHIELDLKGLVEVEVHGFYEAGDKPSLDKAPIRLWSTKDRLKQFLVKGPAKCLNDFLQENTQAPKTATRNQSSDSLLSPTSMSDTTQDRRNHSESTTSPIRRTLSATQLNETQCQESETDLGAPSVQQSDLVFRKYSCRLLDLSTANGMAGYPQAYRRRETKQLSFEAA
jgi:hypothetical protein